MGIEPINVATKAASLKFPAAGTVRVDVHNPFPGLQIPAMSERDGTINERYEGLRYDLDVVARWEVDERLRVLSENTGIGPKSPGDNADSSNPAVKAAEYLSKVQTEFNHQLERFKAAERRYETERTRATGTVVGLARRVACNELEAARLIVTEPRNFEAIRTAQRIERETHGIVDPAEALDRLTKLPIGDAKKMVEEEKVSIRAVFDRNSEVLSTPIELRENATAQRLVFELGRIITCSGEGSGQFARPQLELSIVLDHEPSGPGHPGGGLREQLRVDLNNPEDVKKLDAAYERYQSVHPLPARPTDSSPESSAKFSRELTLWRRQFVNGQWPKKEGWRDLKAAYAQFEAQYDNAQLPKLPEPNEKGWISAEQLNQFSASATDWLKRRGIDRQLDGWQLK